MKGPTRRDAEAGRLHRSGAFILSALLMFMFSIRFGHTEETNLKPDEEIVFYPSIAQRVPGRTNEWHATVRGCVFEMEKWRLLLAAFRKTIEFKSEELTAAESALFTNRARLFLVDNERRKRVSIRLGSAEFFIGKSAANGKFQGAITFTNFGTSDFTALTRPGDARKFSGQIFPLEAEGLSIISDIDDTIKITEVRDRRATLRNTFLREFQPVPGMAAFYQTLAREPNASFHYVSASPWQLYLPLATFVASNGFPAGTFELKNFRWKDRSFFSLFANPEKYKPGVIEPLLKQFPQRKFILIGDSGERDPEIYGALARNFPAQIRMIYIRDVTDESATADRYQQAFHDVSREKWRIFKTPGELNPLPK